MEPLQNEIEAVTRQLSELLIKQAKEELKDTLIREVVDIVMERVKKPDIMPKKEVLEMLDIDPSTLHLWEKKKKLKRHGMIGNKVYYSRSAIERLITNN